MAYFFANQWDSAIVYFRKAQTYPLRSSNTCINRLYLGISHFNLNQLDSAKHCVTEALTYPAKLQQRSGCYNILHRIANAEGDSAAIHHYAAILITYKDSMMRKENTLSYQATAMDDKADALQDKKHRRQMTFIAIALALVVIVALAVYCLRTKYHQRQKEEWNSGLDKAENRAKQAEKALLEEQLAHQNTIHQNQESQRKKIELCINELRIEYVHIQHYWREEEWNALKHSMLLHGILFVKHLTQQHPNLNIGEIHLCILELLGFSQAEMAVCLALSPNTINKKRLRLAQKLEERLHSLRSHLITLCK
jgi:flagellar biosynthesis GTPase FlhF